MHTGTVFLWYPVLEHHYDVGWTTDIREIGDLDPYAVYRARGEYEFSSIRQQPYFRIRELLPSVPDSELEEIARRAKEPVKLDTRRGEIVFDRNESAFSFRDNGLGISVSLEYEGKHTLFADDKKLPQRFKSALTFLNEVLCAEFIEKAQLFGAERVLKKANDWRNDVADSEGQPTPVPELSVEDVYSRLVPTYLIVPHRGNVKIEFDDGNMFGGHGITVKTKRDGTPVSAGPDI